MAEAFFNKLSKTYKAISAGIHAVGQMSPLIIELMKEEGVDISDKKSKQLKAEMVENASRIIALGDDVKRSELLQVKMAENWHIPDPVGKSVEEIRAIRDSIKEKVINLVKEVDIDGKS